MAPSPSRTAKSISLMCAALIASAIVLHVISREHPEYFRRKTDMEKQNPVCVLGAAERSGTISPEKTGIRNIYINWKTSFPHSAAKAMLDSGALPMITWEPYLNDIRQDNILPAIASGKFDPYIARFARAASGMPLFIRFGHEPNSDWYGWSGANSGPETYIRAFRRVRDIFLKEGNRTSKFIFCVNAEDVPAEKWNRFENYYPGEAYADIIGIDAYNWGNGRKDWQKWRLPSKMLRDPYERTVRSFPAKPVFITETASCSTGGDKSLWIRQLQDSIATRFPAVKALVWFDMNKECDWALAPEKIRKQFYQACGAGRFSCSGKSLDWIFERRL